MYYTIRFGLHQLFKHGQFLLGHNFKYTGEVHIDHWVMQCTRCGVRAGIDVGPQNARKRVSNKEAHKH